MSLRRRHTEGEVATNDGRSLREASSDASRVGGLRAKRILGRMALALPAFLLTAAACGGGVNKAGGDTATEPTLLTFANVTSGIQPQVGAFADEVERLSDGVIEIEFKDDWRGGVAESVTIEDVRGGEVDMAWVGARAFDDFRALLAPLLVDSYDLEERVFAAGIPARMLDGFEETGLVGIALLPGPMRKVLGVAHPFVRPSDFAGRVVGSFDAPLAEATMRALGATPKPVVPQQPLDGLDGLVNQLASIQGNRYWEVAEFVTANLNLWPRPLVIFMNAEAFDELTPDQQEVLRRAATNTIGPALEASRLEDAEAAPSLCRAGMTVVKASESDLAEVRAALDPVYAELEGDPKTKALLDEIRALKKEVAAPAESFTCEDDDGTSATESTPVDGLFVTSFALEELTDSPFLYDRGEINDGNWGDFTFRFDRGTFTLTQENSVTPRNSEVGSYRIGGDVMIIERANGERYACRWSLFRDTLTFERDDGLCPTWFLIRPWTRQP